MGNHARNDACLVDEIVGDGLVDGTTALPSVLASKEDTPSGVCPEHAHGKMRTQIVRSAAPWSAGLDRVETSSYEAWLVAIASAKHYIYIEQQYVITRHGDPDVLNDIGHALLKRVEVALAEKRVFRIIVVIPMKVGADAVSYFTRRSLVNGETSLRAQIEKMLLGTDKCVEDYLSVCRLHSAAKSPAGEWKESTVFVHSKAMIADDRVAVIGSANLNDRSMRGDGDSELGALVWDDDLVDGAMNGEPAQVGRALREFRVKLWKSYLGGQEILDPVCDASYHGVWRATAAHNQKLLEDVFPAVPKASITSHGQWVDLINANAPPKDPERLALPAPAGLRGLLVEFPRGFLGDCEQRGWLEYMTINIDAIKWVFQ